MSLLQLLSLDSAASWLPAADIVVKATLMFAAAGAAAFGLRRGSAAARHLIWTLALAGVLLLPILSIALPRWSMPLLTIEGAASASSFQLPASSSHVPVASFHLRVSSSEPAVAHEACDGCPAEAAPAAKADRIAPGSRPREGANREPSTARRESRGANRQSASWPAILLTLWIAGALLILARLVAGVVAVWWM